MEDITEQLGRRYAVLSLAKAADQWVDINLQNELIQTVKDERPDFVLLSVSGNDMLGDVTRLVFDYDYHDKDRSAEDYIRKPVVRELMRYVGSQYTSVFQQLAKFKVKVLVNGYDFPDPRTTGEGGQWIGPPLAMIGIEDRRLWRGISAIILKTYDRQLRETVRPFSNFVTLVKTLRSIGTDVVTAPVDWVNYNDEIHGSTIGFGKISSRFSALIDGHAA